ncbi:hypothetical protein O181_035190 [Austropuccinia psidii MF-1]|uniref:TFIIS N-terminal domain-containing protein n=1 Tax=Austropuccinia psidii MF-1 TaxID=1389203 RepID=A0A9Q3HAY5_9BASI|nr:hypothetical protein [Austropuccinia psidii MF-1]
MTIVHIFEASSLKLITCLNPCKNLCTVIHGFRQALAEFWTTVSLLQTRPDTQRNTMDSNLEHQIFGGGESDLSDADQEDEKNLHNRKQEVLAQDPEVPALAEAEPVPLDPEEQRRQELYDRIDEAAGKNRKGRRSRRKGNDEDLELMADEEVSHLRTRMIAAVNLDIQANEQRRPATSKLVLLPLVTSTMQKSHLETAILDNGVLEAVKRWLEPLPDRSLPALNIQRSLLQLLSKMSIDTQSLKASQLGRIVLFYTKCPRVDPSIKRLADNLVSTWLRPIIRLSASYRSRAPLPIAPVNNNYSQEFPPRPSQSADPARAQSQDTRGSQRAKIPETIHQAFQYAPMSQLDSNANDRSNTQNSVSKKNSHKATAKKTREWARKVQDAKKGQRMG